jgi:serine/threonine-protein kinase
MPATRRIRATGSVFDLVANNTSTDGTGFDGTGFDGTDVDTRDDVASATGGQRGAADTLRGRTVADRYVIDDVLSTGANTIVCDAVDLRHDAPVTLKVVQPDLAAMPAFRTEFERAVAAAASLHHPNIADVSDWGDLDVAGESTVWWVVEHLSGGSLRDFADRGRLLTPSQALVVGLEAARALDAGHRAGLVHTELTPAKLVFGEDRRLRVIDFGLARLLGESTWADPAAVPNHVARYASPEQALGLPVGPKSDVYALSLTLIEAVTGSVPFAADSTVATLNQRVDRLMPVSADLGSLAAVLERAGRSDPTDRYDAAQLAAALVDAASKLPRPEPIEVLTGSLFALSFQRPEPADATAVPLPGEPGTDLPTTEPLAAAESPDTPTSSAPSLTEPPQLVDESPVTESAPLAGDAPVTGPPLRFDESPDSAPPVDRTEQMPVAATAPVAVTAEPEPRLVSVYDEERPRNRTGRIAAAVLVTLAVLAALAFAAWWTLRTKSFDVPDLAGVEESVAMNEIAGNGWEVTTERGRSDEFPTPGVIISTDPAAGVKLAEGETFVMVVSDGPEFRTLPEFAGETLEAAVATIGELALNAIESPERVFSEDVPTGTVVSWKVQGDATLGAGADVLPGRTVELTVSKGPEPRPAPNLVGQTLEAAKPVMDGLQLSIGRSDDVFSTEFPIGVIALQEPAPGTPVERGGTVTVRLSKGPELLPLPDLAGLSYAQAQQALTDAGFVPGDLLGTTEGSFVSMSVAGDDAAAGDTFVRGTSVDLVFL